LRPTLGTSRTIGPWRSTGSGATRSWIGRSASPSTLAAASFSTDQLVYHLPKPGPDGRMDLTLTPLEFIDRLATLIAPSRMHRHRDHGVLAPNAPLRAALTALAGSHPVGHADGPPLRSISPSLRLVHHRLRMGLIVGQPPVGLPSTASARWTDAQGRGPSPRRRWERLGSRAGGRVALASAFVLDGPPG
jgi:hypothetical protein